MLCQAARVHSQWGKLQLDYCQETCTFNVPHDAFSWRQRANGNWAGRLSDQPPLLSVFLLKNIFNWKFQRLFHPLKNPFKKSNIRLLEPITHTEPSKVKWIDGPLSIYPLKPALEGWDSHLHMAMCSFVLSSVLIQIHVSSEEGLTLHILSSDFPAFMWHGHCPHMLMLKTFWF